MSVNHVLFDTPGARGRRRIHIIATIVVVLATGLIALALQRFAASGQLAPGRWQPFTQWPYVRFLWEGLQGTLRATAVAALLSFPLGAGMAVLRLSRNPALRHLAGGYVELFRSLPLLLLIFAFLLVLPPLGLNLPIFWKLVVPIVMVNVAVLAEVFRAGIRALDRGQHEAAAAIGLTHWQTMRIVVLPQAIRMMAPALVAQLVSLLKDSTLGYVVSYPELMKQANSLTVYTHLLVQPFLIVSCIYVVINLLLSQLAHWLERRSQRTPRAARPVPSRADVQVEAQAPTPQLVH